MIVAHQAVPGTAKPGHSAVYISAAFPNLPTPDSDPRFPKTAKGAHLSSRDVLELAAWTDARWVRAECFDLGLACGPTKDCLGRREWDPATRDWARSYTWDNYAQVGDISFGWCRSQNRAGG